MNLDKVSKCAQTCFQNNPTIVLGSGASMPHGLPSMGDLSTYLNSNIQTDGDHERTAWLSVKEALAAGQHLEAALEGKNLPTSLLSKIVNMTWECVNEKDFKLYCELTSDPEAYPLGALISALFKSSNLVINVVTTNYDRVVEFACNSAGLVFQTGFAPGYLQKWETTGGISFQRAGKPTRVVKIWKVHGSLDWFRTSDDRTIGLPVFSLPTNGNTPLIVTPGLNKYEKTYEDPFRTTINGADEALKRASAFLTVGFGFRDQHIHPKIIERCREKNVPIVVLAKALTDEAKLFLKEKAGTNYLGIEHHDAGCRIYDSNNPNGEVIDEHDLWSLHGFNKLVTKK